ncbi:MAG: hypothetical protein KC414_11870 [Romboutsia sp.]|nr:hypothetical protein [Romboutsia sp.]
MLCACAEYKSRLTARSGDYDEIKLTKKLEYPNGVKGFALGDKYVVPEVASKSDTGTPSIEPPEYLKK